MNASIATTSTPTCRVIKWLLRLRHSIALGCAWAALTFSETSSGQSLNLITSFDGVFSGWTPADPIIAAGPSSLVTMVSGRIAIFDKQGAKLFEQNLGAGGFWAAQGGDQVAEPWVIFDPNSGRFIASAADFGSRKGFLYLAVSKDSNPLSSADWHKYSLDRSGTHQGPSFPGVPTYPDYAKLGVDGNAIYVTSGHFAKDQSITASFSHAELFALDKAPLLSGELTDANEAIVHEEVITQSYSEHLAFSIHPAIVFGPSSAMYFVQSLTRLPDNKIVVHALTDVLTAPSRVVSLVPVAPFDRPPNVPQRGSTVLLENIDARLMSAVVRNGALWTAHAVEVPADEESVVRWYQFDITGLPTANATLLQSGDVDPGPGLHTWLPAINVDVDGNMGLVFSVGGANQYAAIGYTGRLYGDDPGTTFPVQTARVGAGPYTQGGWGEYSGLAMDSDGYRFWLFHEYPTKQKTWRTFVGAFQLGGSAPGNVPPVTNAGADQIITDTDNNGVEIVTLSGAASSDSDGSIVAYEWREGATLLGAGVSISPTLAIGTHTLTLTVTDNAGAAASDMVVVEVRRKRRN